ncbi:para-aminobenzoate synthase [Aaosphaeria arxii CBS 175.79]|uniref:aminodeoxychorismate synthase n=1 Tax=Aaosphaeria arxii CBS 175.79 TaxID=1450172 RepID=A0A6A5XUC9_9PLEO|nr:para-aminobenzoate synthase [Aaosphaeria arxii CBS 175.79]KAF2016529.1 para-aminobenzoate synthase [Aaosphaeria arxii CBS 175.79]
MPTSNVFARAAGWIAREIGLVAMSKAGKDVYILIFTRFLRLVAFGAIALILARFFEELGFSDEQIGLFMTLTLLGDVAVSLLLTLVADELGRRKTLLLGSFLMSMSGVVFATTSNYIALLIAAILGVISPTGNEIGPFRAIEESTLAHLVHEDSRAEVFTWHVVFAALGTSTGLAVGGQAVDRLQGLEGWTPLDAYRGIFWIYTLIGLIKALCQLFLGRRCEKDEVVDDHAESSTAGEREALLGKAQRSQPTHSPKPKAKSRNPFTTLSKPSRTVLLKLCSLFFFDSLGSGMVSFTLINWFMQRKFHIGSDKLGGIMSATWILSTLGTVFASSLARRLGLIQAMIVTHLPSAIFLGLLPAAPNLGWTIFLLAARSLMSSMDQAPRSAFLSLVVLPEERTAVMGIVNIMKTFAQSSGPTVTGILAGRDHFWVAFVVAGSVKAAYDLGLLTFFAGRPGASLFSGSTSDAGHFLDTMSPALLARKARILYLDAYDSFSNNIVSLVEETLDAEVTSIYIDDRNFSNLDATTKQKKFEEFLQNFDGVIAGPGPGWPNNDQDVGLMKELWALADNHVLPVLGICLGFQSLALAFGAEMERLNEPRHGLVAEILHNSTSIFEGVDELRATQYHSLTANIGHPIQTTRAVRYPRQLWDPTEKCPKLEPLAWDFDNRNNGAVLMAVRHTEKPFYGVQFHPESICTNSEGTRLFQNWWADAQTFNLKRSVNRAAPAPVTVDDQKIARTRSNSGAAALAHMMAHGDDKTLPDLPPEIVHCKTTGSGRLTVADVCEVFDIPRNEAIILESGLQADLLPLKVGTGRYSILGLIIPGETLRLHYYSTTQTLQLINGHGSVHWESSVSDPWEYLRTIMQHLKPKQTPSGSTLAPFWGGLMGYASYEAGLDTINVKPQNRAQCPDICFAYITRSIVFDHQLKKIYVQSIRGQDDKAWIADAAEQIYEAAGRKSAQSSPNHTPMSKADPFETDYQLNDYLASCKLKLAEGEQYRNAVAQCQEYIADGQSYELCLTTQNEIRTCNPKLDTADNNELSWKIYQRLTKHNPAPFSAYIRLHNVHVLSSSPERYISWDRNQTAQCRPIKGTVRKLPGTTREDAVTILSSSKERAENLMIVDLVRHQLHRVYGSGNVNVSQLMEIEEYETLWQLVSVVNAIPPGVQKPRTPEEWQDVGDYVSNQKVETNEDMLGFDAFVQSLPPGSMTGAPKKRSCEILEEVEGQKPRGIYSGVLGYLDVGGAGDFSVVIRTAIKIDDEDPAAEEQVWKIGAGGAVTSQSTPEGEYEEMKGKFLSTGRAFEHSSPTNKADEVPEISTATMAFLTGGRGTAWTPGDILRAVQELQPLVDQERRRINDERDELDQ